MTSKPSPILVPVDFSNHALQALRFAAELSDGLGNPLLVMHAVHDPGEAPGLYSHKQTRKRLRKLEELAQEMLEEFLCKARKSNPKLKALRNPKTLLVTGLPVSRILEVAEKVKPKMIVMGSQGRTGLAHALIGSKAEQVTRLAKVPVTIVHRPKKGKK